jgi:membrane protein required for beta-lactamase induction
MESTMIDRLWNDIVAWWATVPPDFAFLLMLPFAVAALGIGADAWRRRRRRVAGPARASHRGAGRHRHVL